MTRALLPMLEAKSTQRKPSSVINIGSVDGTSKTYFLYCKLTLIQGVRVPALETFAYSASKSAVHQLTRVLASQLGSRGITVNGVIAGPFPSKMMNHTLEQFHDVIVSGL